MRVPLMIIMFIMGFVSFILLVFELTNMFNLERGIKTKGFVDTVYTQMGDEGGVTIYKLKFSPNRKDTICIENFYKTDDSRFKKGELVDILYPMNNPQKARIDSGSEKYGAISFLFIYSLITLLIGFYTLLNPIKVEALLEKFGNGD